MPRAAAKKSPPSKKGGGSAGRKGAGAEKPADAPATKPPPRSKARPAAPPSPAPRRSTRSSGEGVLADGLDGGEPKGKKRRRDEKKGEASVVEGEGGEVKRAREKRAPPAKKDEREKQAKGGGKAGFPTRDKEEALWGKGYSVVAGVDEAGRGPLAGPVVAAACVLPRGWSDERLNDSKKVDEEVREAVYEDLVAGEGVVWHACVIDHERIDEINILASTMEAMAKSVEGLRGKVDYVLIDGNRCPTTLSPPCEAVVKGDAKCLNIAAASIIAKVTRDRLMRAYHDKWPQYNFAKHKGYGTADHVAAIFKHGPCPIHRMTFAPLKTMPPRKPTA